LEQIWPGQSVSHDQSADQVGDYAGDQDQEKGDAERPGHRFNPLRREAAIGVNTSKNKRSRNIDVGEWSFTDIPPKKMQYRPSFWSAQLFHFDLTGEHNHSQSSNHQSLGADSNEPIHSRCPPSRVFAQDLIGASI